MEHIKIPDVVILDPKGLFNFPGAVIVEDPDDLQETAKTARVIIYRPDPEAEGIDHWNRVLRWVYLRGNTVLYIDELFGLSENGTTYPPMLKGIYTRGREKGITVIGATQRPVGMPKFCRTEGEYYYCFLLRDIDDRRVMAGIMGQIALTTPVPIENRKEKYYFYFVNDDMEMPIMTRLDLKG